MARSWNNSTEAVHSSPHPLPGNFSQPVLKAVGPATHPNANEKQHSLAEHLVLNKTDLTVQIFFLISTKAAASEVPATRQWTLALMPIAPTANSPSKCQDSALQSFSLIKIFKQHVLMKNSSWSVNITAVTHTPYSSLFSLPPQNQYKKMHI